MRKFVGFALRFGWLAVCVAALVSALRVYRGETDWQVEEGLGMNMIVLGFPISVLVTVGLMALGFVLNTVGTNLHHSSRTEMVATWLAFVAAGCIQWFVLVPYLVRRARNSHTTSESK